MAHWLRLHAPNAGGLGFDPWSGNLIPHAATKTQHSQINLKKKNKEPDEGIKICPQVDEAVQETAQRRSGSECFQRIAGTVGLAVKKLEGLGKEKE